MLRIANDRPKRLAIWWRKARLRLARMYTAENVSEQSTLMRASAQADRFLAIDSSHMGRIVLLPSRNLTRLDTLQRRIHNLDGQARSLLALSFAEAVPASLSSHLFDEQRQSPYPSTTEQQIAAVLRKTGAAIAIQPLVSLSGKDSVRVHFVFYRDMAHTKVARAGAANLESTAMASIAHVSSDAGESIAEATQKLALFVISLESCDAEGPAMETSAPWCWGEGRRLYLANRAPLPLGTPASRAAEMALRRALF